MSTKRFPTNNFYDPVTGNFESESESEIKIKDSRNWHFAWSGMMLSIVILIFLTFKELNLFSTILSLFFSFGFIGFLIDGIKKRDRLIINPTGVKIDNQNIIKWKDIKETFIEIEDNSSGDSTKIENYLILKTENKEVRFHISGLTKNYEEVGHFIETGMLKYSNKGLFYKLK